MNTQESNKLIAEFMGYEVKHNKCYSPKYNDGTIAPMQFHKSWDWLRPVMVKIDTYANSDSLSIAEYEEYRNKYFLIAEGSIYDDILDTHKQVVQFIKSIQLPF